MSSIKLQLKKLAKKRKLTHKEYIMLVKVSDRGFTKQKIKELENIKAEIFYAREAPVGSYEFDNGLDFALSAIDKCIKMQQMNDHHLLS